MKVLNKKEWMAWVWPGYHWYQGINPTLAYQQDMPKLGYKFSQMAVTYAKGTEAYYFIKSEYKNNGAKLFQAIQQNPKWLFKVLAKTNEAAEQIFKLGKKWQQVEFHKLTDKQLLQHHKGLFFWDGPLWRNGQIPNLLELDNNLLSEHVKLIIRNNFKQDENEVFRIFTTSTYESVAERQDQDFLTLLQKYGKLTDKKKISRLLRDHWRKYNWMTYGWSGPALTLEYFEENFKQARGKGQILKSIQKNIRSKGQALKKQKQLLTQLAPKDRELVILLRGILEQKSRRVDAHSLTYYLAEKMMVEIGKRVGLSLGQMRMVLPADVPKLFRQVNENQINQEYNRVLLWFNYPTLKKYTGATAEKKLKQIYASLPKVKASKELKGELAYGGKVRGRVRLILDIKDSPKFKKGEILVTRMTDPSYISIMKLSKAIVTDIGGITCHAAIVSREMKKPCIVGTKTATQVLKDADLVEVDATNGVVRRLGK
jgi:phosphohistidine swiveling domain-containing protein